MKLLPGFWRKHFLLVELVVAGIATCALIIWSERFNGWPTVAAVLDERRGTVYGVLASIFGSLLGFAIAAQSIVLALSQHERLEVVRKSDYYPMLWKVFVSTIRMLGFATTVAVLALIIDRDSSPFRVLPYLVFFAMCLTLFRVTRCVWVLENVVGLVAKPEKDPK